MVVTGLNRRLRNGTPCSLSASRMLSSLKESAKGSPWSRAKRARTSCRFIIYGSKRFLIGGGGRRGGPSLRREKQRQGSPPTSIVRGSAWQCSLYWTAQVVPARTAPCVRSRRNGVC